MVLRISTLVIVVMVHRACAAAEPPMDPLIAAVEDWELALENVSADAAIEHRFAFPGSDAPPQYTRWRVRLTLERAGRYRVEGQSQEVDAAGTTAGPAIRKTQAFNGQRRVEASGAERFTNGRVAATPAPFILPIIAADLIWTFNNRRVSERFKEGGRVAGTASYDGHTVQTIETNAWDAGEGRVEKDQFYVDPERGFAVVKKARLVQDTPTSEWRTHAFVALTDLAEIAPGIWLPGKAVCELFNLELDEPAKSFTRSVIELDHWVVNAAISDTVFDWSFPPNVAVNDDITGKVYMSGAVNDELIRADVESAARLVSTRSRKYIVMVSALVVAGAVVAGWIWRGRRRAAGRG